MLWAHALGLAVVLAALVPWLGAGAIMSADEGAVLAQLEVLDATGGWALPNPLPTVDPDGRWFGLEKSETNGADLFPYAKHAAYPAAVRPLYAIGGKGAVVAASAAGTWAAAVLAALLARRLDRRLDVATLWTVGIVSPLFFDSFWAIAHSIGAAFATGAVLAATGAAGAVGGRRVGGGLAAVAVGVVGAAWFRSEGVLLGLALGAAVALVSVAPAVAAWRHGRAPDGARARSGRDVLAAVDRRGLAVAVTAGAAALAAWWTDARWSSRIIGTSVEPFRVRTGSEGWVAGRLEGLWNTVLRPQLSTPNLTWALLTAMATLAVIAAVYARRRPSEDALIRTAAVAAALCALVALALPKAPVPGLAVAFPMLPVGLVLVRRPTLRSTAASIALATFGLFVVAVSATQYAAGGSMEWGGRYFHLAIPALVPVLLVSVREAAGRLDATTARVAGASLAVVAGALVVVAAGAIVRLQGLAPPVVTEIVRAADATVDARHPGGPVVVSNMVATGRFAWEHSVHSRYLTVPRAGDLPEVARRLSDAGVTEFVYVSADRHGDVARLEGYAPVVSRSEDVGEWRVVVVRRVDAT